MNDDVRLLSRPATLGDVVAWVFTVATIVAALLCPRIPFIVPNIHKMFDNLHAQLPQVARLVLSIPGLVWVLLPLAVAVAAIMMFALFRTKDDSVKVTCAVASSVIVHGEIAMAISGILMPILGLQKQLS